VNGHGPPGGDACLPPGTQHRRATMLRFAIVFLILALVAGVLGFTGIAGQSMEFAKILFLVFLVLFLLGLVFNLSTGKRSGIV
jgi:uncharacterized membrane protein YtjA (UPF0391 family)